jgi:hypothetical protein
MRNQELKPVPAASALICGRGRPRHKNPDGDRHVRVLVRPSLGIERWEQRAGSLGETLGKHPDVVSRWARSGAERRSTDHEFAELLDELDAKLSEACRERIKIKIV